MKTYDPFPSATRARRRRLLWALGAAAVLAVAALVAAAALLSGRLEEGERLSAPGAGSASAPPTGPESDTPWPTHSPPVRDEPVSQPPLDAIDRGDPQDVAEGFVLLATAWDTTTDLNESAAAARAADVFGAPELVLAPAPERPSAEWVEPARHAAHSVPVARASEGEVHAPEDQLVWPETGEPIVPVVVEASYGWRGVAIDGGEWVVPDAGERTVAVSLVQRDGKWMVIDYGFQPVL